MRILPIILLFFLIACTDSKESKDEEEKAETTVAEVNLTPDVSVVNNVKDSLYYTAAEISKFKDENFIVLKKLDSTFSYNMKYATGDNFLNKTVYECADCLVRYETAKQLIKANDEFKKQGFRIQFFDCYRPLDIQKQMWKIFPDKRYVANPAKGSNHNRGTAVDITLINEKGEQLQMGTKFDFFGKKAHHAYQNLPKEVLENRKLLKSVMIKSGFWAITSEWWHYNLNRSGRYSVSNFKTECE